jgi:hypothetical protein
MFFSKRKVVLIVDGNLPRTAFPIAVFENSTSTRVDAWSNADIELHRGLKKLQLKAKESFVVLCDDAQQVRFFTVHSIGLTDEQLRALHSNFCEVFDAPELVDRFNDWSRSDRSELVSMNKFMKPHVYNFSVHRTYDKSLPWFASVEVAWSCEDQNSDSEAAGKQSPPK